MITECNIIYNEIKNKRKKILNTIIKRKGQLTQRRINNWGYHIIEITNHQQFLLIFNKYFK